MKRLVARATIFFALVERAQIERVNGVADVVSQMPLGQPLLQ